MLLAASPIEDTVENNLGKAWKKSWESREMPERIGVYFGVLMFFFILQGFNLTFCWLNSGGSPPQKIEKVMLTAEVQR